MQHIKMLLDHRTILSDYLFLHVQCLIYRNLQLLDACLVRSGFSPCSGHRTAPKRSKFKFFRLPALLCLAQNVHRDPPIHLLIELNQKRRSMVCQGVPVYILCKAKRDWLTKTFEIRSLCYRSMAGAWGENRSDETYIKKLKLLYVGHCR